MMALAIAAAVTFMAVSYLLVINPVARLQGAQARLRQGDLSTRLPVDTDDEFGQLSAGFNLMAHALQASHEGLEQKVQEKTASIAVQNQRLEALYAVSGLASDAASLTELANAFVRQARKVAGADAVAVRWSDEANERYVLLANDGLPRAMAEEEHCLHTGSCHCGQPQEQARTRVIPIPPTSLVALPPCREAGFATMVTIPAPLQHRVRGAVALFFRFPVAVNADPRWLLESMTRRLASAM